MFMTGPETSWQLWKRGLSLCALLLAISSSAVRAEDWMYTVRAGENLWDLAERYLISVAYTERLQALNSIADPYHLPPGTRLRIPVPWLKTTPISARVVDMQGEAWRRKENANRTETLGPGSLVAEGDLVTTGNDSNLTLEFVGGSRLLLQADSRLRMNRIGIFGNSGMTDTRLRLDKGRLETQVAPRQGPATHFEISTPSAITSVRGTDYRVDQAAARLSRAEVLKGQVGVQGAGVSRLVNRGQGILVGANQPPKPPVPLLPAPDLGALPAVLDRAPVKLTLPKMRGSSGYRVQLSAQNDFSALVMDQVAKGVLVTGPDIPDGHYYLRARAIDVQGLEGFNAERPIEINARPEPPLLLEPKPGVGVAEEQPAFAWSKPVNISRFHFQVAREAHFQQPIINRSDLGENQFTADASLPLGRYYWRVAAVDEREGAGPFSDPQEFRRVVPAPALEEPDLSGAQLQIRCRSGLPGQRYQFQLAEDQAFSTILLDRATDVPVLELDKPKAGVYYVRVRTIDPDGFQNPYGPPQILEVPYNAWWLIFLPVLGLLAL